MAKVDGELQGIHEQIKALLKTRMKSGRSGDGRRSRLAVVIWRTLCFLRRRAARRRLAFGWKLGRGGRLPGKGVFPGEEGGSGGGRLDVEEVIRQLHLFSEEERERCMRPFTVQSEEVSGLSDEN